MTTLLLLHGMGATAGVWADVINELDWSGDVRAVDLAGHGEATWSGDYSLEGFAAAISDQFAEGEDTVVVGHSLGGAVGLCLASGSYRPAVSAVIGLGIKMSWSDDDVAGMAKMAARGVRFFESRDEAIARYVRVAGLDGLVALDHPAIENSVVEAEEGWRLAQDPATFAQNPVDMTSLMAAARASTVSPSGADVILGAGSDDPMVSREQIAVHVEEPRMAPGCGHSVQVEQPDWVANLISTSLT